MLRFQLLLRSCFLLGALFGFVHSQAQDVREIKDSTGLKTYSVGRGETVLIGYDSAYILNKRTFKLYQDNYKRIQAGNSNIKSLMDQYEHLIAFQDSMMKEKEAYYQGLKTNFDSLASTSNRFADRTDANITAINQSLSNASSQLVTIKGLLDDSLNKLKQEQKKRFTWALGGFAVGIGVGTLIAVIAN